MNKYKVKVKHDTGNSTMIFYAKNEIDAREQFLKNEYAPDWAIVKVELIPYYVTMTDKFMSGWGMAERKTNKFIVVCENWKQAQTIERNAKKRPEMNYINICSNKPKYGKNVLESWKTFAELGEIWKQN